MAWRSTSEDKWPANSPDLNPIENLWSHFSDAVADRQPRTMEQFKKLLLKVWWDIDQNYIKNLYDSMGRRLDAVIAVNGKPTKY